MKALIFLFLCVILIWGCSKPSPPCASPPQDLILRIYDIKGEDLLSPGILTGFKDSVTLFYIDAKSGIDTLKSLIELHTDANQKTSYQLIAWTIGGQSAEGTKTFYLRRSHSITDTIYADYVFQNTKCRSVGLNEIKFNGVHLDEIDDNTGYCFKAIGKAPIK